VIENQGRIAERIQRIADVKDDEFEGDGPVPKALTGMLPPLLGGMPSSHKMAPKTSRCWSITA
jgi:hypothetical protein